MFSFFTKVIAENSGTAYDYEFNGINGDLIKLSSYEGKVIVVVNVMPPIQEQHVNTNPRLI